MFADHVTAQNSLGFNFDHQLEQTTRSTLGQGLCHGTETGPVNHHPIGAVLGNGILFRQPHRGQLRLTEHGTGHQCMVHLSRTVSIDAVSEGTTLINRHRSEADAIGHITNSKHMGHIGALISIHGNAIALDRHSRSIEVETLQKGPSSSGQQHPAAGDSVAPIRAHNKVSWLSLNRFRASRELHIHAFLSHPLLHDSSQFGIKTTQQMLAAHKLCHFDTKATENAGEFTGDEASTHHDHSLREPFQQKHVVADPAQLDTWNIRPLRAAADTDEHPFSLQALLWCTTWISGNNNVMVVLKPCPAFDQSDLGLRQKINVHGIEAIHLSTHIGQQLC